LKKLSFEGPSEGGGESLKTSMTNRVNSSQNVPQISPRRPSRAPLGQKWPLSGNSTKKDRFPYKKRVSLGSFWGTFSALFSFRPSRIVKKEAPGGPSKPDLFFYRFWGLTGGRQEGSRVSESAIFAFSVGPQFCSKMGAKMERFGLPNPNYTNFWAPWAGIWRPKRSIGNRSP